MKPETQIEVIKNHVEDPMQYPQLNPLKDCYQEDMSFAQKLRSYIEFVVMEESRPLAEDPEEALTVIY